MSIRLLHPAGMLILLLAGLQFPMAIAGAFDDLEVHGFVTQGFIKTSANRFFGDSGKGSFEFNELGINAAIEPTDSLRLSGQILSRQAGDMSNGSPVVDFAVADLSLFSSAENKFNVLIGRVKNPIGLYNDTRDVAFTRPALFLPQTVYFQSVRSLALSADGVALRANHFSGLGDLELQVGFGQPLVDDNVEYAYLGQGLRADYENDGLSWVGRLMFTSSSERWRFAFSAASVSLDFDPAPGDAITQGETDFVHMVASARYSSSRFSISAEYTLEPVEYYGFAGTAFDGVSPTYESFYTQANWRVIEGVDLMLRHEQGFIDRNDRDGSDFQSVTGLPGHSRYSKATAVGLGWEVDSSILLRAEYQWHKGTMILSNKENPLTTPRNRDWEMFALSFSYRF